MESGRITTQRWPSFSSLAACTAAAMAVPELPPVTQESKRSAWLKWRPTAHDIFLLVFFPEILNIP